MKNVHSWLVAIAIAATASMACSKGSEVRSLTGPTPLNVGTDQSGAANSTSDADRSGSSLEPGAMATWAAANGWAVAADGFEVEGTDVITAVSGMCPNVVLTVRGIPVTVTGATVFKSGSSCSALVAGRRVEVKGILTVAGGAISVLATRIQVEGPSEGGPGGHAEVEGRVASVSGTCPALTITLQGVSGTILTTGATSFSPSTGCARIAVGTKIEAKGTLSAAPLRQLTATVIKLDDDQPSPGTRVEGEGVVTSVQGTCPALTLVIAGQTVRTTAATEFRGGACSSIRPGTKVEVRGVRNGTVLVADRVKIDDDDDDDDSDTDTDTDSDTDTDTDTDKS